MRTLNGFKHYYIAILIIFSSFYIACDDAEVTPDDSNNSEQGTTAFTMRLTDGPGDYQQVNINVQQVRVQLTDSSWVDLTTNAGYYDLLTLQNGVDTVIVQDSLTTGTVIAGLRLVLGDSNTVMVDSNMYTLMVPSGSSSGYKIKFQDSVRADSLNLTLDFDAEKSIVKQGAKDEYLLKPVITVK